MSLVVSDTGPLNYLVLCRVIEVVPRIYRTLVVPSTVLAELQHPRAPEAVRAWTAALPDWAQVRKAEKLDPASHLGMGEREAISLALQLDTELLIDERAARRVAAERGLSIAGTVGVMEKAAEANLIDLPSTFDRLRKTNFRFDSRLLREAIARDARRRERSRGIDR